MKLENVLDIIDLSETQKQYEQKLFDLKLEELKNYQNKTVLRKNKMCAELFPEKLYKLIVKLTSGNNPIDIKCGDDMLRVLSTDGYIKFRLRSESWNFVVSSINGYDEIYNWWATESYRKSHMVKRMILLNNENKMCDIIESNIECIYTEIAKRLEMKRVKEQQENTDNFSKLSNDVGNSKTNKVVKITIEIME